MARIQWKLAALNTKNTPQYFILAGELFLLACAGSGAVLPPSLCVCVCVPSAMGLAADNKPFGKEKESEDIFNTA